MSSQPQIPFSLFCILLIGCGSTALTPDVDAEPPMDTCMCQAPSLSKRVGVIENSTPFLGFFGLGAECRNPSDSTVIGEVLGGSAIVEDGPNEDKALLRCLGPWWCDILPSDTCVSEPPIGWYGVWDATTRDEGSQLITTAACVSPAEGACERDYFVWHSFELGLIPAQSSVDLGITCERGILVGGGCPVYPSKEWRVSVIRAGFDPADPDRWLCSWNSEWAEDVEAMAFAFCLEETIPDGCGCCSSLEQSRLVRTERQPLRYGANRLQVGCEAGETLLLGNCMLEGQAIDLADFTMFRYGFPPGDRTQWDCSWNNPSAATSPYAIASAVCLTE